MTENEAKSLMLIEKECINRDCNRDCAKCDIVQEVDNLNNAYDTAIKALEEVQQYRQIGTVEECRESVEKHTAISREIIEGKYFCPKCNNLMPYPGYCGCGQKLY